MHFSACRSLITLCLILLLTGCGSPHGNILLAPGSYPEGRIEEFIWETRGGGDLYFTIASMGSGFEISIERYAFQPSGISVVLTEADLAAYRVVYDIFLQNKNLYDYKFIPVGTTGTWTTITLLFSGKRALKIENIKATDNELRILADFVRKKAQQPN